MVTQIAIFAYVTVGYLMIMSMLGHYTSHPRKERADVLQLQAHTAASCVCITCDGDS